MKNYFYLLLICIVGLVGCKDKDDLSFSNSFTIDTENCTAVGSYVQGSSLNNLCKIQIPYVNGNGGQATISSESVNGISIPSITVDIPSGNGQVEVPVAGIPVALNVTYLPIKVEYNGATYFTSVGIPIASDPDPNGTITFTISNSPIVNLTQKVDLPFTVSPTMATVVDISPDIQGLSVNIQSDPNTGKGIVTLIPSASFLGDTLKLTATFGARPTQTVAIPVSYFASGAGTQQSPYIVTDDATLAKLQYGSAKYFQLANNITCTSWSPLPSFGGHLDGNGKTITYSVNTPTADSVAFIKRILTGAAVQNLTLKGSVAGKNLVAGLAAYSAITPVNCDASQVNVSGANNLAVLVASGTGKDANVLQLGALPATLNILAGTSSVSAPLNAIPKNVFVTVTNNPTGATVSYDPSTGLLTAALPSNPANFTAGNVTYTVRLAQSGAGSNVSSISQTVAVSSTQMYASGTGIQTDPYIVMDEGQLQLTMQNYPAAYIKLGANIPCTQPWIPITAFSGDLNGAGFSISGMNFTGYTVDATNGNGFVNVNNGTIHDVQFLNVDATMITNKFGIVAGTNNNTVKNVSVTGTINSTSAVDVLGGIAGELKTASGNITNCYVNVSITAACGMVGGIAGRSNGGTSITNCTAVGSITITAGKTRIGGILGRSEGSSADIVKGCLSQVIITGATGANNMGGIFGANSNNYLKIEECMFTGTVKGDNDIGGIAGTGINVKNCVVSGATLQNVAAPSNGSVGGICSTNKGYELNCIVRGGTTITGTVGTTTRSAAGIGSFYQSASPAPMGYPGNCLVTNTTITGGIPNRISGPPQTGGNPANNYATSDVIIQTSATTPVAPIADPNGQDGGNAPATIDQAWYTSTLQFDFTNVWTWNSLTGQPDLRNVGCSGIPMP